MARARNKPQGEVKIQVATELLDLTKEDEAPKLEAYAFSPGGTLLDRTSIGERAASLSIPAEADAQSVRIVVGPPVDADHAEALAELLRRGAGERFVRLDPREDLPKLEFPIARPIWTCWFRRCLVRGTLLKRVTSGGVPIDLPVCGAEVEIYEVDPLIILIPKIPIDILKRLREIVRIPIPPIPDPPPEGPFRPPRPEPDSSPIDALLAESAGFAERFAVEAAPAPAGDFVTRTELAQVAEERFREREGGAEQAERTFDLVPQEPEAPDREEIAAAVRGLAESSEIRAAAAHGLEPFKAALIQNPILVRPLLCAIFPRYVTMQLVGTATTDDCGHFQTSFWLGCTSDVPDLYFIAYRRLGFLRIPIYQPLPVACHTWWDYACGTEVTLYTSHPFAHTCPPCRPVVADRYWVLVMAVGNTPLSRIHGTGAALTTTSSNVGLTDGGAPFGGLIRLRVEFDNALRDVLNVRYYRVSWKHAGLGGSYVALDGEVHRHYAHWVGTSLVLEAYSLGPRVVGAQANLFEIPPALPPIGQWSIPDAVEDTTSAKFPTGGSIPLLYGLVPPSAAGIYKLRLELFDAAGNPVDISALGIHYVVPTSTDLNSTIFTTEAAALGLVPGPPVDSGNAFVMRLHVDNNPTSASIAAPLLNGSVAADACGVLKYSPSDTVTLAYTASHPNGFAWRTFRLRRGVTDVSVPGLTASGDPVSAGPFSASPSVSSLLGPCPVAGFAEELYVGGTATDGWSRQGYDASDLRAFVLAPPP
jgi:hypothetical protein